MTITNEPSELDRAIERVECDMRHVTAIGVTRVTTDYASVQELLNAAKLLNNGPELLSQRWNILLPEIERTFTHKANLNTVKLERDELAKRCQQLELDVKLGIESHQEICKERDDLQGGRIDLARQSLALKEQLSQLRESRQTLVKERDSFATTIHQQHFGRYGIVELQQQLFQLRAEYKKALEVIKTIKEDGQFSEASRLEGKGLHPDDKTKLINRILSTPLAIETMKDKTI